MKLPNSPQILKRMFSTLIHLVIHVFKNIYIKISTISQEPSMAECLVGETDKKQVN